MSTAFNVTQWQVGDVNYVVTYNANLLELANNAVHKNDIAGLVAMGGDPTTVNITVFKNGTLGPNQVPGRNRSSASGAPVDLIDLNQALWQANLLAFQGALLKSGSRF